LVRYILAKLPPKQSFLSDCKAAVFIKLLALPVCPELKLMFRLGSRAILDAAAPLNLKLPKPLSHYSPKAELSKPNYQNFYSTTLINIGYHVRHPKINFLPVFPDLNHQNCKDPQYAKPSVGLSKAERCR